MIHMQRQASPPAHVRQPQKQAPAQVQDAHKIELRHSTSISVDDTTTNGGLPADEPDATPAPRRYSTPALADARWMVPDGDGWAEVYGDGDGWAVYDTETWAPAVSYDDCWAVPSGDGWAPYEPTAR